MLLETYTGKNMVRVKDLGQENGIVLYHQVVSLVLKEKFELENRLNNYVGSTYYIGHSVAMNVKPSEINEALLK